MCVCMIFFSCCSVSPDVKLSMSTVNAYRLSFSLALIDIFSLLHLNVAAVVATAVTKVVCICVCAYSAISCNSIDSWLWRDEMDSSATHMLHDERVKCESLLLKPSLATQKKNITFCTRIHTLINC